MITSGIAFLVLGAVIGYAGATIGLSRLSPISWRHRRLDREIRAFFAAEGPVA